MDITQSKIVQPAALLQEYAHLFQSTQGAVLDLACGKGQNGLYLQSKNIDVLFADIQSARLIEMVEARIINKQQCWPADFESESQRDTQKLSHMQLQGVIVFRYLHRELFSALKQSIKPGGIVIYETFTEQNKQFGRPHRPQFLLKTGELKSLFEDWQVLFYFEGIKIDPDRAVAQIVCRKPD